MIDTKEFYDYLKQVPLYQEVKIGDKDFYFVHGKPSLENSEEEFLWGQIEREEFLFDNKIVVFGHTPTAHYQNNSPMSVWTYDKKIGIDCGCGWQKNGGRLGCICLETMEEHYINVANG